MMFNRGLFSSNNHKWHTPPDLITAVKQYFPIDLDVCASEPNICERFYSEQDNGLEQPWNGRSNWMNPVYGRQIIKWMTRARTQSKTYQLSTQPWQLLCLVPARTDTQWWQSTIPYATQVTFIRGRLTFGSDEYWQWLWEQEYIKDNKGKMKENSLYQKYGKRNTAPFPSAFVAYGLISDKQHHFLNSFGWSVYPSRDLFYDKKN